MLINTLDLLQGEEIRRDENINKSAIGWACALHVTSHSMNQKVKNLSLCKVI